MKRALFILLSGLILCGVSFYGLYFIKSAPERSVLREEQPELAWLKEEFKLSDADYRKVCELHEAYLPKCEEMCHRIAVKNAELRQLIAQTNQVTPAITRTLEEASLLRAECHKGMLAHFFAVSQAMPTEQGKRYLEWVEKQTLLQNSGMMANHHDANVHE